MVNDLVGDRAAKTVADIGEQGGRAEAQAGDVTDSAFVNALIDGSLTRHGRLDILHSNAGYGLAQGPLLSISGQSGQLSRSSTFCGFEPLSM